MCPNADVVKQLGCWRRNGPGEVFVLLNCAMPALSKRKFARVSRVVGSPRRCGVVELLRGILNSSKVGMEKVSAWSWRRIVNGLLDS